MFVTDISCWQEIGRGHREFFGTHPPKTSIVEVRRLIEPEMMIEIEADAISVENPRVDGDALV
jgi:isochorismate pyruvate lyase